MITKPKQVEPTEEELYRERTFHVKRPWQYISLLFALGGPPLLWWIVSQDMIPNGHMAKFWFLMLKVSCAAIFLIGISIFLFSFRSLRVNQAGLHFMSIIGGRSMPWDELLAYDVSPTGRFVDIIDFRGRQYRIDMALYGFEALHVLKRHVAGSRQRAFEHVERRGLNCIVRNRICLGPLFALIFGAMLMGVIRTSRIYPPETDAMLSVYWALSMICVVGMLIVLYKYTSVIRVDRFSISRRTIFGKMSISFSQAAIVELWIDPGDHKGWQTEWMAVSGRGRRRIQFSQSRRSFLLVRDYIVSKCPHVILQDLCPSDWPRPSHSRDSGHCVGVVSRATSSLP